MDESSAVPRRGARPPHLVGRTGEQTVLREVLAAALAGRGGLALIGGSAGIGKTALAGALGREAADHGALVLVGRAYEQDETPPYGPWIELLARCPAPPGGSAATLDLLRPGGATAGTGPIALFAAVVETLAAVARQRPLVLLLED